MAGRWSEVENAYITYNYVNGLRNAKEIALDINRTCQAVSTQWDRIRKGECKESASRYAEMWHGMEEVFFNTGFYRDEVPMPEYKKSVQYQRALKSYKEEQRKKEKKYELNDSGPAVWIGNIW